MLSKYKKPIIILILLVVVFYVYSVFFVSDGTDDELLRVSGPEQVQVLGQDIIRNLNKIAALDLSASVFSDPVLRNLRDFSEEINPQESGRRNPFAPFSGVSNTPAEPVASDSEN